MPETPAALREDSVSDLIKEYESSFIRLERELKCFLADEGALLRAMGSADPEQRALIERSLGKRPLELRPLEQAEEESVQEFGDDDY